MPAIGKSGKREKEMALLMETRINEGCYFISNGEYDRAERVFSYFINDFEKTLTDENPDALEDYYEIAEELLEESRGLAVLKRAAGRTADAEKSRFLPDFKDEYNELAASYTDQFPGLEIPLF